MESEQLFEVERIAGERQGLQGKREYLVQWKGYGWYSDTWEPEENLVDCAEALRDFRLWQAEGLHQLAACGPEWPQSGPETQLGESLHTDSAQVGFNGPGQDTSTTGLLASSQILTDISVRAASKTPETRSIRAKNQVWEQQGHACPMIQVGLLAQDQDATMAAAEKVAVPTRLVHNTDLSERESSPCLSVHGLHRCGRGIESKPLSPNLCEGRDSPRKSTSPAPGKSMRQAWLEKECSSQRRPEFESRKQAFESLSRFCWRQEEGRHPYQDIVVRKQEAFTHIILFSRSSENNCLNPGIMAEMQHALSSAATDGSRFVLLGAVGITFCGGLDLVYLSKSLGVDPEGHSEKIAEALKSFVNHFIHFQKPIVAAVHGPAVGLGASILALCDIVWSSEKAWFQTPYATQGQTPDGWCSLTFPMIMGGMAASEMLLSGRKLTAKEACDKGLVSQVFDPDTFTREVMARVKKLASYHPLVLQECKSLMGCSVKADLEQANIRECETLKRIWASSHASQFMLQVLDRNLDLSDLRR